MDALIRAAGVGTTRMRLKTAPVQGVGPVQPVESGEAAAVARLREEIEAGVREEMAAHMQSLCDVERERARAEGYAQGLAEARSETAAQLELQRTELAGRMESVLQGLSSAHELALCRFESDVGDVSFAAVCRLVGREAGSRSFAFGLVEQACAALRADAAATVRLHPRDIDALADAMHGATLEIGALGLRVIADETLVLGGCMIESARGDHDGGLESQLRRLHAVLSSGAEASGDAVGDAHATSRDGQRG
jgi:flagellar assembly protein FliH